MCQRPCLHAGALPQHISAPASMLVCSHTIFASFFFGSRRSNSICETGSSRGTWSGSTGQILRTFLINHFQIQWSLIWKAAAGLIWHIIFRVDLMALWNSARNSHSCCSVTCLMLVAILFIVLFLHCCAWCHITLQVIILVPFLFVVFVCICAILWILTWLWAPITSCSLAMLFLYALVDLTTTFSCLLSQYLYLVLFMLMLLSSYLHCHYT